MTMSFEKKTAETQDPPKLRRLQFSLRSLLLFVTVSALVFAFCAALGTGFGLAVFATGFFAMMALVVGLIGVSQKGLVVVHQAQTVTDAILCRNYLREHGIAAVVHEGELPGFSGVVTSLSRVLVPAGKAKRARRLLRENPPLASAGDEREDQLA